MKAKGKRKYIKRNFALYRLSGMMGNLAHMLVEFRNDEELNELISEAMDAIAELSHTIKVHRDPGQKDEAELTPRLHKAFLLHGLNRKISEIHNSEVKQ
jgi:Icc-related predicted phosphoesterase